jgi:hypothetical protein
MNIQNGVKKHEMLKILVLNIIKVLELLLQKRQLTRLKIMKKRLLIIFGKIIMKKYKLLMDEIIKMMMNQIMYQLIQKQKIKLNHHINQLH